MPKIIQILSHEDYLYALDEMGQLYEERQKFKHKESGEITKMPSGSGSNWEIIRCWKKIKMIEY